MVKCCVYHCNNTVSPYKMTKYCDAHQHMDSKRPTSSAKRGYGGKWRKARKRYLAAYPLCARCLASGVVTAAEVVDHIIPHKGDLLLFWDRSNWQSLCVPCHNSKTASEDMGGHAEIGAGMLSRGGHTKHGPGYIKSGVASDLAAGTGDNTNSKFTTVLDTTVRGISNNHTILNGNRQPKK
jgi:5-methylcytosine-specific restriction protein A